MQQIFTQGLFLLVSHLTTSIALGAIFTLIMEARRSAYSAGSWIATTSTATFGTGTATIGSTTTS